MNKPLCLLVALLLPCSAAIAGDRLSSPQVSGYGKDVPMVQPVAEDRLFLPQTPVGLLTVGGRFSEHLSGAFLDTITPLFASRDKNSFLFFDSGTSYEDVGQTISQYGFGFRQMIPNRQVILGVNAFYDMVESRYENEFSQYGFGAELLTHYVDARFNYFLPDDESTEYARGGGYKSFEAMREGYNAEVGVLLPGLEKYTEVRVFGGYYQYDNRFGSDHEGFKARLEARLLPGVIADLEYLDDTAINGSNWTAGVRVSVPFSALKILSWRNPFEGTASYFKPRPREFTERMSEMVMRSPARIVTSTGEQR